MIDITEDIRSLTEFKRRTNDLLDHIRQTGRPLVLTLNGQAVAVVQDASSYQALIDRVEAIDGIRRGLEDKRAGRTEAAGTALAGVRKRRSIPRL